MKIIVLNGSPKGDISVTMQYIKYIQKKFPTYDLKVINISQRITRIENDNDYFQSIINDIKSSDGVIWAFPLYVFTVHSNYQRFIELIFERNVKDAFIGKYASVIATSIHFYDHTAINYINSICDDLNMNYVDYFSLQMYDMEKEHIRANLIKFARNYFDAVDSGVTTLKNYDPIVYTPIKYIPEYFHDKITTLDKKIIVVADSLKNNNLKIMVDRFINSFSQSIELVNLQDIDIKGGCLGCLKCGYNYECAYADQDDFISFYNSKLKAADIIVFAGTINHRHLSSTWKKFLDRGFFNTHTPSLSNKQIGFILSGALRQIPNLRQILESYVQWQKSNLVGFVTDEYDTSIDIDKQLYAFSHNLIKLSNTDYSKPQTFLGVAAMKIFRDEIWGKLRFPFIADHKAYKSLGVYDFPHRDYKSRIINMIPILLCKLPSIRKNIYSNKIKTSMIDPLKRIVDDKTL